MTWFLYDENSNRVAQQQWANPAAPQVGEPGALQGSLSATGWGLAASAGQLGQLGAEAVSLVPSLAATGVDEMFGTKFADRIQESNRAMREQIRTWRPDPNTTGVVGQVLYGAATVVPQAAIGFAVGGPVGAALLAGTAQGYNESAKLIEEDGVDTATALGVGGLTGATTAIGVAIPGVMGTRLLGQLAYSVTTNVGLGMVQRGGTAQILEAGGYSDMAENYRVLDGMAIATDAVLGAAVPFVGKIARRGENTTAEPPRVEPKPSEIDAAHYGNEVINLERDSAPGFHKTPDSVNAHVEATLRAQEQLFADNRAADSLDVADLVARTDMVPDTRPIQAVLDLAEQVRQATPVELRKEIERITKLETEPAAPVAVKAPEPIPEFPKPAPEPVVKTQQSEAAAAEPAVKDATTVAEAATPGRPIPDQLADRMFEQVKAGEDTGASPITQVGESIYQRGGFQRPEEFRSFVQDMARLRDEGLTGREYQDAVARVAAKYDPPATPIDPLYYSENGSLAKNGDVPPAEEAVARQALAETPDMTIIDEDGNAVSAREYLDNVNREIEDAKKDTKLHDVAIACFMLHGDQ